MEERRGREKMSEMWNVFMKTKYIWWNSNKGRGKIFWIWKGKKWEKEWYDVSDLTKYHFWKPTEPLAY
jgi:hypothetical protein